MVGLWLSYHTGLGDVAIYWQGVKERAYSSHGETITSLPVSIPLSTVQPNKLPVSIPLASVVLPSRAERAVSCQTKCRRSWW